MFKGLKKNAFNVVLFGLTVAVMVTLDLLAVSFSSVYYILIGGAVGIVVYLVSFAKDKKSEKTVTAESAQGSEKSEKAVTAESAQDPEKSENPVRETETGEKEDKE